jgi:hypothetical protein
VTVRVRDLDNGATDTVATQVADETSLDLPSALDLIASIAVGDAGIRLLDSFPPRQSGTLCMRIAIRERKSPLRFCNRYAGAASDLMIIDASTAIGLVLSFSTSNHPRLHVLSIDADEGIARGVTQGLIAGASAPRQVRPGHHITARIRVRIGSARRTKVLHFRVPKSVPRGPSRMILSGTPPDDEGNFDEGLLFEPGLDQGQAKPPRSLAALARRVAAIHRFHGVEVTFRPVGKKHPRIHRARVAAPGDSNPVLRISGSVSLPVTVR